MNWSISESKMFNQCPRKWFYHRFVANGKSNDKLQQEALHLKKLQSIPAWRGILADRVISNFAVPKLNKKQPISEMELIDYATNLANQQLLYATGHKESIDPLIQCSLYDVEYNGSIDASLIDKALEEVKISLRNFINSNFLKDFLQEGKYIISQRTLRLLHNGLTVSCTPDILAFYDSKPPAIVDWKVQASSHLEHWKQLAVYAYVVSKIKPHADYPYKWHSYLKDPTNIDLIEFQLLHGLERKYKLSISDIAEIEDFIYSSSDSMIQLLQDKRYPEIKPSDVPTTLHPSSCLHCQFKRICWENQN